MKNNFITKIIGASLAIAMMIGVGVGLNASKAAKEMDAADSGLNASTGTFVIDFYDSTKLSSTSGTALTSNNYAQFVKVATGLTKTNVVTGVSATGTVQFGKNGGLTVGSSSNNTNSVSFTIGSDYAVTRCTVYAAYYEEGRWKLGGNAADNQGSATYSAKAGTITASPLVWNNLDSLTTLSFTKDNGSGSNQKRLTIHTIVCEYSSGGQDTPTVTGITKKTSPNKTEYYPGESFDPSGLVITASLSDSSSVDIAYNDHKNEFDWNPKIVSEAGDIQIQYQEYSEMKVTQAVTLANPISVSDAITAINSADENTVPNAYVSGKISQIDSYSNSYHSITYWISDDGTTTNQLQVYGGKGLYGANFNSIEDVELRASVVVYGTLKLYNQAPEFDSGNIQVSYTVPTKTLVSISLSGNFKTSYYTSESLNTENVVVTAKYDNGSTADVTDQAVFSEPATAQARRNSVTVSYTEGGVTKTATYRIVTRTRIQSRFNPYNGETVTEGNYIISYEGKALKNAAAANNRVAYQSVTFGDSTYYTTNDDIIWRIAKDGDYYTIYNAKLGKYLAATGSYKQAQLISNADDDKARWTITSPSAGEYEFENLARGSGSNEDYKWLRENTTYGFACYNTNTGGALTLYKEEARTVIENQVTETSLSYQYTENDGVYAYSQVAIRFTGSVDVQTWKDLDSQYHIIGYGIMFAATSELDVYGPSKTINSLYQPIRNYYSSVDECFVTSGGKQYLNGYVNKIKYFYTELADSESHPAQVGNEYGWNLYKKIDDSAEGASLTALTTSYTAVAFIRTQLGELFFMNEESVSAGELAYKLANNGTTFSNDEVRGSMEQMACLDIAA